MNIAVLSKLKLRTFNNLLSIVLVCLSVYIFVWPFLPQLSFWWRERTDKNSGYSYQTKLEPTVTSNPLPSDNRLVIPRIYLDEAINEGATTEALSRGIWRRPQTSKPSEGKNTVIVGHRYTFNGNTTFYNLDKLQINDVIIIYWEGKEYDYVVDETVVVPASAIGVEGPTDEPRLTLYTCTPLWSAKDRLVIKSRLMKS